MIKKLLELEFERTGLKFDNWMALRIHYGLFIGDYMTEDSLDRGGIL